MQILLYYNNSGNFVELAKDYAVDDTFQNGRGTALSDIYYRGRLDILTSNWEGPHRAFVLKNNKFVDIADKQFSSPSRIRTVISADFDNDGYDEVFMNNIGEPNKLFKILDNGEFKEKDIKNSFREVELWADKVGYENININEEKFDRFLNINTKKDLEKAKENLDKI